MKNKFITKQKLYINETKPTFPPEARSSRIRISSSLLSTSSPVCKIMQTDIRLLNQLDEKNVEILSSLLKEMIKQLLTSNGTKENMVSETHNTNNSRYLTE